MEFEVGDLVERINTNNLKMKIGDRGVIKRIFKILENNPYAIVEGYGEEIQFLTYLKLLKRKCEENVEVKEVKKENDTVEELNKLFGEIYNKDNNADLRDVKDRIASYKRQIEKGHKHIAEYTKMLREAMIKKKTYENEMEKKDFTSDIEALLNHDLVEKVEIDEIMKEVYIYTDYITIFDEDGNKYQGNKYGILLNFDRMYVRFKGLDEDYNRASYWTDYDPHPHVDGDGGYPCLGDAGSMLASTLNDYELYASFIIALNFLQQVNTNDPAGEYIRNWDCIDDDGNIIDNPHEVETFECYNCNAITHDADEFRECNDCGELFCPDCMTYVNSIDNYVCDICIDEYEYCHNCNEYYKNEDGVYIKDNWYCEDCASEIEEDMEDEE